MTKTVFVTGTDTDAGKTLITTALLAGLNKRGKSTAAIKPVAAGAEMRDEGLRNADGLLLQRWQTCQLSYQQVNPVLLQEPLAPHIAADLEQRRITISQLSGFCRGVMMQGVDKILIEGAGGWRVPLNDREYLSALPVVLNAPVLLVIGMRLGCLNHALLTAEAILADGLPLLGWVANQVDPVMAQSEANLHALRARMPGSYMGFVPWLDDPDPAIASTYLDYSALEQ